MTQTIQYTAYQKVKRPISYNQLMDLYEQNYIRLRCLMPDMNSADVMVSQVKGYQDLHAVIQERCKYTVMLNLTYQFKQKNAGVLLLPNMNIRIYHDAKTAELQNRQSRVHQIVSEKGSIEHQWRLNRFLYKFLGYCLFQGHKFYTATGYLK